MSRVLRSNLFLLALLAGACEAGGVPKELQQIVRIRCGDYMGWGSPIGDGKILTARHLIAHQCQPQWETGRPARVLFEDSVADLAVLAAEPPDWLPEKLKFAQELPLPGDELFMRAYVPNSGRPTVIVGRFLGIDREGTVLIDGLGMRGMSGSGILNSKGELVGFATAVVSIQKEMDSIPVRALIQGISVVGGQFRGEVKKN